MRIALVKVQDTAKALSLNAVQYPINIGYLASVCIEAGHQVEMWDFCVEPFTEKSVRSKINNFKPDIIGLSCVTPAIYFGHHIASIAKQIKSDIFTIVGGSHVSAIPLETLREFPNFDLGVIGEGEDILLEIITRIEKKRSPRAIPGTVYRTKNKVRLAAGRAKMPDVDSIPFPNRDLVPFSFYKNKHAVRGFSRKVWNIIELDSSRGCPFSCTFCSVEKTHGQGARFRSPENVIAEIEICRKKYDTNFIVFNDSTFTLNKRRISKIVRSLPKMGIKGYTVNGHVNTVDYEMLEQLAKTGCRKISFGIESGSNKTLKRIRKQSSRKKIMAAFKIARKAKIPIIEGSMILGADPYETEKDFKDTASLIKIIRPDILTLGIITPYPGTAVYKEMKKLGYLDGITWNHFQQFAESSPPWKIVNFSAAELAKRRNAILKSYIWRPDYIFSRLVRIKSLKELLYYIEMAKSFYRVIVKSGNGNSKDI